MPWLIYFRFEPTTRPYGVKDPRLGQQQPKLNSNSNPRSLFHTIKLERYFFSERNQYIREESQTKNNCWLLSLNFCPFFEIKGGVNNTPLHPEGKLFTLNTADMSNKRITTPTAALASERRVRKFVYSVERSYNSNCFPLITSGALKGSPKVKTVLQLCFSYLQCEGVKEKRSRVVKC